MNSVLYSRAIDREILKNHMTYSKNKKQMVSG